MFKNIVCGLGLIASPGIGASLAHAGAPAPQAPAMLEEVMKSSPGSWKCDGEFTGPDGAQEKTKSTAVIKRELNGNLYVGEFSMPKTTKMPAMKTHAEWYYDGVNKMVVSTMVSDTGDAERSTSTGKSGDSTVWTGEGTMMGQMMKTRMTTIYKNDKELMISHEIDKGGSWIKMGEQTCKK